MMCQNNLKLSAVLQEDTKRALMHLMPELSLLAVDAKSPCGQKS